MGNSKIRPTEGEFDNVESRSNFAKCYFWKQILKLQVFKNLIANSIPKFDKDLPYYQNQWELLPDIQNWQKENGLYNNSETKWLESLIFEFIKFKAEIPEVEDTYFQPIMVSNYLQYYPPKVKGLHTWLYGEYSAEKYIESQRLQAFEDLDKTDFVSLPRRAKNYVANARAEQAKAYTEEVTAILEKENPQLKSSVINRKYEQHFKWLLQVYFDKKQYVEVATAENADITNVSREVNKLADLLGFSKPSHIKKGRKKGTQNNPITSKLGKK